MSNKLIIRRDRSSALPWLEEESNAITAVMEKSLKEVHVDNLSLQIIRSYFIGCGSGFKATKAQEIRGCPACVNVVKECKTCHRFVCVTCGANLSECMECMYKRKE